MQVKDSAVANAVHGCSFSIDSLAIVLSTVSGAVETPLLEVAALSTIASARHSGGLLLVNIQARLLVNVYSNMRLGWEPAVEPWSFGLQLERATEEYGSASLMNLGFIRV